jgi:hypothetical protein
MGLMLQRTTAYGIGAVGAVTSGGVVANEALSAGQMRNLMENSAPDIDAIEQSLVVPTKAFNSACPS